MRRIAFLTARCLFDDDPNVREDAWEHRLEFEALAPACKARAMMLEERIWDDPDFRPADFDAVVIGTCWDYMEKPAAFLETMASISEQTVLLNPFRTVKWNSDKAYLRDLAEKGVPTIETIWAEAATRETVNAAFAALSAQDIVIKPRIGASAWRQARLQRGEALPPVDQLPPGACLIQPFLSAAETEGELTLLFFDRIFSHGLVKRPKAGDYRTQSMYGASEEKADPPADALEVARAALAAVDGDLLYARVDLMRGPDNGWKVMELELIEPYLYPEQGRFTGAYYAAALDRLLAKSRLAS